MPRYLLNLQVRNSPASPIHADLKDDAAAYERAEKEFTNRENLESVAIYRQIGGVETVTVTQRSSVPYGDAENAQQTEGV